MGTEMGPSYANLFVSYIENQFFNQYDAAKPELYGRYIDDCIGTTSSSKQKLNHFCKFLSPGFKNITVKFLKPRSSSLMLKATVSPAVCTTKLQTHTVIYYVHLPTHHTWKTPFRILNFLDFDVCAVMTLLCPTNRMKCSNCLKHVVIPTIFPI